MQEIILASASPRRQEILTRAGIPFIVCPAEDGKVPAGLSPADHALYAAKNKAVAVAARYPDRVVLGADTVVARDGVVLGKPVDAEAAVTMLCSLQGRSHTVITGVWVCTPHAGDGFTAATTVWFYPFSRAEATAYVATGEPMDKAGAYGIQGQGMRFVERIDGDFYNVMGLPGAAVRRFLQKMV